MSLQLSGRDQHAAACITEPPPLLACMHLRAVRGLDCLIIDVTYIPHMQPSASPVVAADEVLEVCLQDAPPLDGLPHCLCCLLRPARKRQLLRLLVVLRQAAGLQPRQVFGLAPARPTLKGELHADTHVSVINAADGVL